MPAFDPTYESEDHTRKTRIDILLKEQGWTVGDRTKVVEEIDTKQSDFSAKDYKTYSESPHTEPGKHAYLDYLLLDGNSEPLAVIEAKRTSRDPIAGQRQAEEYLKDIKKKYKKDVFIYLTNGFEIWFWNYGHDGLRQIRAFHSRADLEKFRFHNGEKKKFEDITIKKEIINRPYQLEAVKRLQAKLDKGKRKFLLVMATGTGKTRVSMAIIDTLLRSNRISKVLFLADRRALRTQAYGSKGMKRFFPNETKAEILPGVELNKDARLYVSTIQTLNEIYEQKDEKGRKVISPGFFDLIISDEAHRSIYNKWKGVFSYFDAYQVGLTATPAEEIERDTFRFFECEDNMPTFNYSFDEAVKDGWLVNFKVRKGRTRFQIKGLREGDLPPAVQDGLTLDYGLEPGEMNWDGTELEKKVATKGTSEALAKEFMENCVMDQSGTLPAKTIIFAISHKHAKRLWEAFEKMYPQYKGKLVQIIDYQMERADKLLKSFTEDKWPRIAITVDMLETGVDIPEVSNLIFAKPVFSRIKFWQMIGRGSRNDESCENKEWLPNGKKEHFLIFDFWDNFEYFKMKPEGEEAESTDAITTRIFLARVDKVELLSKLGDKTRLAQAKERVIADIKSLPTESVSLREHSRTIEKALASNFWENVGIDPFGFLRRQIAPLMRFQVDVNLDEASFQLKVEKLAVAILRRDVKMIERLKGDIGKKLNALPPTLRQVRAKKDQLARAISPSFWKNPSLDDADMLEREFLGLMQYARDEPNETIVLDLGDEIAENGWIEYGPNGEGDYVQNYRDKVEKHIKQLAKTHPTIRKIQNNETIGEKDLLELEKSLNSPDLFVSEETLRKVYAQSQGSLTQFIRHIIGLYKFPDAKLRVEEAFKTYMLEKNYLNANQINFMRTLQTVFANQHHIDIADFYEPPFTNLGSSVPTPLFSKTELEEMLDFCGKLEHELFPSPSA